ncbi:MAG: 16S rRNA (guanine(527)-N(7))-methyltransferase RsmG [Chloroflexi bacterium]|nr:16S rRNA (guanine(527)-N(7))-methyltransferase RsmG [Chloroflexota bacterium]
MNLLIEGSHLLGIPLSEHQLRLFRLYAEELALWNRQFNLTAVTDYEGIQTRHFLDSITCLLAFPAVEVRDPPCQIAGLPSMTGLRVIDIGAGGGFPGLPLKIVCPEITLTLLDSVAKKTKFLDHLVNKLGLAGVHVVTGRAEEVARDPQHRERYDVVVSRAVAELAVLAELCLPFARVGGRMIAPKKGALEREIEMGEGAVERLGGRMGKAIAVELPGFLDIRHLIVVDKVSPTPAVYPRRPGIPSKRPLR